MKDREDELEDLLADMTMKRDDLQKELDQANEKIDAYESAVSDFKVDLENNVYNK